MSSNPDPRDAVVEAARQLSLDLDAPPHSRRERFSRAEWDSMCALRDALRGLERGAAPEEEADDYPECEWLCKACGSREGFTEKSYGSPIEGQDFDVACDRCGSVETGELDDIIAELISDAGAAPEGEAAPDSAVDQAYRERNALVAMLTHLWPSHIAYDPKADSEEWKHVVFVELPTGQVSWHVHAGELAPFSHLEIRDNEWDGHSSELKWERVAALRQHHLDVLPTPIPSAPSDRDAAVAGLLAAADEVIAADEAYSAEWSDENDARVQCACDDLRTAIARLREVTR